MTSSSIWRGGKKTKQKYDLPGQEVMHRGNQQAFICFPFLKCHPWLPLITSLINKNTLFHSLLRTH